MPLPIDTTLRRIARQTEEEAAKSLAVNTGNAYAALDNYPFSIESLKLVTLETARSEGFAIYLHTASRIRVALLHPENDDLVTKIRALAESLKAQAELTVVSRTSFTYLLAQYSQLLKEDADRASLLERQTQHSDEENYFQRVQNLADMQAEIASASTTKLLDVIMAGAINQRASDIHLEPGETQMTVRFRIDGVLQNVLQIPMAQQHGLLSRIKVMASLKLEEKGSGQDGRFSLGDRGIQADVRVATIPTGYGEGVVMRILRHDQKLLTLNDLGFTEPARLLIETILRRPYGLILVTGPTGSGKSTTLYALLQLLNTPERKIITLEDPIEYRIAGLQQSQIDQEHGFGFAEGLKNALRQDPDVVMVGEIRDPETATIALNASLTGHLVLATLHTNNAVTAPTRLLEMGIQPYLLTGAVQLVIAQRLVRRLGPGSTPEAPRYAGRLVISELLAPKPDFDAAVARRADQVTLEQIARADGMQPMAVDGFAKVQAGLTSQAEIERVTIT